MQMLYASITAYNISYWACAKKRIHIFFYFIKIIMMRTKIVHMPFILFK